MSDANCKRCGHPPDWHRVDDADPSNYGSPETWKTRCLGYDCEAPGPPPRTRDGRACDCSDFVKAEATH